MCGKDLWTWGLVGEGMGRFGYVKEHGEGWGMGCGMWGRLGKKDKTAGVIIFSYSSSFLSFPFSFYLLHH